MTWMRRSSTSLTAEPTGDITFAHVYLGSAIVVVSVASAFRPAPDEQVWIEFDAHDVEWWDDLKLAQALEPFDLLWLEDPVPPENIEAQRHVTHSTGTPICTGENLYRKHGYRELIEKQAARIIAPDIPKMGGLKALRRRGRKRSASPTRFASTLVAATRGPVSP
jgi:L-alanine-DL-glutamate epimerase-like enolase superfamily enzyme